MDFNFFIRALREMFLAAVHASEGMVMQKDRQHFFRERKEI